jgi:hypothetical protein
MSDGTENISGKFSLDELQMTLNSIEAFGWTFSTSNPTFFGTVLANAVVFIPSNPPKADSLRIIPKKAGRPNGNYWEGALVMNGSAHSCYVIRK